jgi:TRAP-type mannitol/chloroaromatic compound transport system substrate-binding protein
MTGAVSAPAIAQSAPTIKWRLTTTFPKTLDTLYGACDLLAKTVADLSDQKFQISVHGPGEIVPPFQVFDAVANNTVEMATPRRIITSARISPSPSAPPCRSA